MKITFYLDNNEFVELTPDKVQIRQLQPNIAALGTEVVVPVLEEDGKTQQKNEDGSPKTAVGFRAFINYNVNLRVPAASLQAEIDALKAELGAKLAEQVAAEIAAKSVASAPAAVAVEEKAVSFHETN